MKSLKLLSIVFCAVIGISTYNATGMEIDDYILNEAKTLDTDNRFASGRFECGSPAVAKLCSIILNNKIVTIAQLNALKEELLEDANFYAHQAYYIGYCGDRNTMQYMYAIFYSTNKLIQKLSPDNEFGEAMNSHINCIRNNINETNKHMESKRVYHLD